MFNKKFNILFFNFQAQETHTPKLIQGKVALCKNCGGYSIDISRCTGCKRPLPEGTKILPDPDYKPPVGENSKLSASAASLLAAQGDLRNIRIAPKKGRRVATSDEPECIALSSDEDEDDEVSIFENFVKLIATCIDLMKIS